MPDTNKKLLLPEMQARALTVSGSFNREQRTVDVIWATETPVRTYYHEYGMVDEILSMDENHIRMGRMKSKAPVFDNHSYYEGTRSVLGSIRNPRIVDKQGLATIKLSRKKAVDEILDDLEDEHINGISAGYRVYKAEVTERDGQVPLVRVVDWEPIEVSFAPIQADPNSSVREKNSEDLQEVEIIDLTLQGKRDKTHQQPTLKPKSRTMTEEEKAAEAAKVAAEKQRKLDAEADKKAAIEAAVKAEKARTNGITLLCRKHGLDQEFTDGLVNNEDITLDGAREAILNKIAEKDATDGIRSVAPVTVGVDREDKMRKEATAAYLVQRSLPGLKKEGKSIFNEDVVTESRKYNGNTALDLAKDSLVRAGVNIEGMSSMEIAGRAFTSSTSDFPVILEGSAQNTLLASYEAASDTWTRFCATGSVNDFREYKRLRMGTFTDLEAVQENGEYKTKPITDADYEKVQATTKGNIINVSRKMIINDDLGAFLRLAQMLGRSAARSIENDVYALLGENSGLGPNMVDGNPLIDAAHSNIGATAAPTVAQIDAMRVIMAQQKDKDSNDFLDLRPDLVLCPLSLGSTLRVLNQAQYEPTDNKFQKPNVVAGLFSDVIDTPRLTGTAYWMFANPNENPVIEVSFLNGVQTPFMEMQEGFTVDGTKWKIRLDYGVGAVDFRGVVRSPGA